MAAHSKINSKEYNDIFDETLALWSRYASEYCSLLKNYYDALNEIKDANITKTYSKIKKTDLDKFPEITLLRFKNKDEAIEYLLNLTMDSLVSVRFQILDFFEINTKLYEDLKAKTFDYRHQVRMKKAYKSSYAVNPDACGCGRKYHNHVKPDSDR